MSRSISREQDCCVNAALWVVGAAQFDALSSTVFVQSRVGSLRFCFDSVSGSIVDTPKVFNVHSDRVMQWCSRLTVVEQTDNGSALRRPFGHAPSVSHRRRGCPMHATGQLR